MNLRKMQCIAAVLAAGVPGLVAAATAMPMSCDSSSKATSTTYYSCTSSAHNALDISSGLYCGEWNLRGMLVGNHAYRFYSGSCANTCTAGTVCNNYVAVVGANGWDFRQLYIYSNANSVSKTCDRCALGLLGAAHGSGPKGSIHAENRQYGTRMTSWYTQAGIICGASVSCGSPVGYPVL